MAKTKRYAAVATRKLINSAGLHIMGKTNKGISLSSSPWSRVLCRRIGNGNTLQHFTWSGYCQHSHVQLSGFKLNNHTIAPSNEVKLILTTKTYKFVIHILILTPNQIFQDNKATVSIIMQLYCFYFLLFIFFYR